MHGAVGIAKWATDTDTADRFTIIERRKKCVPCDNRTPGRIYHALCKGCPEGIPCFIWPKTANAEEACPLKKWDAVKP